MAEWFVNYIVPLCDHSAIYSCTMLLKKVFYSVLIVWTVLIPLIILLSRASILRSVRESISYRLSKKLYGVREPSHVPDTSSAPDLIVRSVYYDEREHDGHKNSIVFLVEIRKKILSHRRPIVACQVDHKTTSQVKVHTLNINGWVGNFVDEKPFLSHTMALVCCYSLPAQNGSLASLHYQRIDSPKALIVPAYAERPLIIYPASSIPIVNSTHSYRIAACIGVVFGRPHSQLLNWLRYQRAIGVDHVHMVADDSFEKSGGLNQTVVLEALADGFLTVDIWRAQLRTNVEIQYHSQMLAYHDCVYQFMTRYDYMIFTDQDDFFTPLVPGASTLHYYIDNWCYMGSCSFNWIEYYPDCGMKKETAPDGNVTSLLLSDKRKWTPYKKCLHRLSAIVDIGIHDARDFLRGYHAVDVPSDKAYVAHVREARLPPDGRCH